MDEGGAWLELGVELGLWGESRRLSCDLLTSDRLHSRSVPPPPPPPTPARSLSLSVSLPTRPRPSPRPISEPFRDPATWPSSPMPESVWGRPARGESSTGVGVCLSRSEKAVDGCSGGRNVCLMRINAYCLFLAVQSQLFLSLSTFSTMLTNAFVSFFVCLFLSSSNCLIFLTKVLFLA